MIRGVGVLLVSLVAFSITFEVSADTSGWTVATVGAGPTAQWGHAMAYDDESRRVVLYSGWQTWRETWTYDDQHRAWTNMSPVSQPPYVVHAEMVYDSSSDVIVLYGGLSNEVWLYDLDSNRWISRTPESGPVTWGASIAYDSRSDRVVLFGGSRPCEPQLKRSWSTPASSRPPSCPFRETWLYDADANAWANATTSLSPPSFDFSAMAYDGESDRTVLSGGWLDGAITGETWAYDFNANRWGNLTRPSGPSARSGHSMAYDATSDRVVLFGGFVGFESGAAVYSNETWAYDYNRNRWTQLASSVSPGPRADFGMTYESRADRMVLFGGLSGANMDDNTWVFDYDAVPVPTGSPDVVGLLSPIVIVGVSTAFVVLAVVFASRLRRRRGPPRTP